MNDRFYPGTPVPHPVTDRPTTSLWRRTAIAAVTLPLGFAAGAATAPPNGPFASPPAVDGPGPVSGSCMEALDAADKLIGFSGEFAGIVSGYPQLIVDAAEAGADWDAARLEGIADDIDAITAEVDALRAKVDAVDYSGPRDDCRDGA